MTHKETLEKAIRIAIEGGWLNDTTFKKDKPYEIEWGNYPEDHLVCVKQVYRYAGVQSEQELIYNHDFAKALWGEEWKSAELLDYVPKKDTYRVGTITPCWQWHLQQMVIAPDPIEYLAANLPEGEK